MSNVLSLLLIFSVFFTTNAVKAQIARPDSLINLLKAHNLEDTARVNLLNEMAIAIYKNDSIKASQYATEAAELSNKLSFRKGLAQSYYVTGLSLSYNKSDKLALDYFLKALKIAEDINYKNGIAVSSIACGLSYGAIGNISEASNCYQRALKIASELKDQSLITRCLANLSVIYTGKGDYKKALDGYQKILQLLEQKDNKKMRSGIFINIGEINKYQGNYPQALESYHKALKIKEEVNDKSGISLSFINIASIYTLQGEYENALEYLHRALEIAEKLNDKRLISNCYEEIGNVYLQTNKPEALEYFQKAFSIAEKLSYQTPILRVSSKIGDFYRARGEYKEALENYSRALKISEELSRKRTICETSIKIGSIYLLQKKYAKALEYTQKSLLLANELKLLDNRKDIYEQLSEIYAATNDYKNAYLYHKQFTEANDSVYNEKNVKRIAELELTYKFEKEKQVIELVQQKKDAVHKTILFSLLGGFVLISFFAVHVFLSSRNKHNINLILTQQNREIEELNGEYLVVNEELRRSNDLLSITKKLVEESEERLRLLIKNSNDILVLVNEKGEQFFISDAAEILTGYRVDELLGNVEEVIYPEDLDVVRQHWERVLTMKDTSDSIQYRHKHKDKGYVWFEVVSQNFLDHPAIKAVVANIRDITERKNVEIALQESEAIKAQLLTNEIERINRELETNQRSMTAATLKLIQNSERDAQTIDRLMEIEKNTTSEGKQKIKTLIADNKRISYNSNWDEFEILFEKVHSSFYEKLNAQFPTLTANERKMCAFLKLNMSNKDIAHITFQSDDALKKARLRLRQKLGIDREINLSVFLQNI
ncbi:MAG: tetratricopeptide repeat protein [Prolixibacteraceae bacterium]|nr:tetratricopeptide repeat protein [Prolixibacteraceae bacterium]